MIYATIKIIPAPAQIAPSKRKLPTGISMLIPNRRFPIVNSIALTTNGINKPTTIPEITAATTFKSKA